MEGVGGWFAQDGKDWFSEVDDAGLVFPEGDAAALATQIRTLMESPETQTDLSKRGYDRAMAQYTNRALARQALDFYQELVA